MGALRWFGCLVAGLAVLVLPGVAAAVPGDVVGQSCISGTGTEGCAALPQPGMLEFAAGVVVSPDGADVYVGAAAGVAHFRRAGDGGLAYANCVDTSSSPFSGCPTAAPPDGNGALSANAINLAISPDGRFLYAISFADALLWWARDPASGDLTWGGCRDGAADSDTNGRCGTATTIAGGNFPKGSIAFPQGLAITPDGGTLYIADQTEGLLQAQLNTTSGAPTPTACFNNTGSAAAGCTSLAADVPMALGGIDLAANSRDVYLRSISPAGITQFARGGGGATSFASCVSYVSPSASCATAAPVPVFAYSGSIAVSGEVVFAHSGTGLTPSGTVSRFARKPDGSLAFQSCATNEASPGPCSPLPPQTVASEIGRLLVSPDGASIYLRQTGGSERSLTRLTTSLAFASCLSDTGVAGCSPPPLPAAFSQPIGLMAMSPDGGQIYQVGEDTLNVFQIERSVPSPQPQPPTTAARVLKAPRITAVKRLQDGRYRVKVLVGDAVRIRVSLVGKLKPAAKPRALGKPATKQASGPGVYPVVLRPLRKARERQLRVKLLVTIQAPGLDPARASKRLKLH